MLKKFLLTALVAAAAAMPAPAQSNGFFNDPPTKATGTFELCENCITQRHRARLGNGNTMTIELFGHRGYGMLTDMESLLAGIRGKLAFVDDSIRECPQCNYRVDYLLNRNGSESYRLRKYAPQGTFLFQKGSEDLKAFKPEADTLHLLLYSPDVDKNGYVNRAQVTFVINRLANLDSLLAQKGRLNHIVDTFRQRSAPKHGERDPDRSYRTSIDLYRNYSDTSKMVLSFRHGLTGKDGAFNYVHSAFEIQANFGAGFLRDHIAPVTEGGLTYRLPGTRGDDLAELLVGLYASGYFAFAKDNAGAYQLQDNWFLNAEFGGEGKANELYTMKPRRISLGVGYLVSRRGDYFTGTTMKLLMNFRLQNGITLSPEIIATNDFRQVFPGLTVKIF